MIDLTRNEAATLYDFLHDPTNKLALMTFFAKEQHEWTEKCKDHMLAGDPDEARLAATMSEAYRTIYNRMKEFAEYRLKAGD